MPQQQQNKNANNFMSYFNSKVLPNTNIVENVRSKINIAFWIWSAIILAVTLFIVYIVLTSKAMSKDNLLWAITMVVLFFLAFVLGPFTTIKKAYGMFAKEKIIPSLLGFWGDFTYVPPINLVSSLYKAIKDKTGIKGFFAELYKDKKSNISVNRSILARILKFNGITYDDKIVGKHNDVEIEIAELATTYTTQSRDNEGKRTKSTTTTFEGVVFSTKMNKNFKGITILSCDNINKNRAKYPMMGVEAIGSMNLTDALSFGQNLANMGGAIKDLANTVKDMKGKSPEEIEAALKEKYGENQADNNKYGNCSEFEDVFLEDPLFTSKFKLCSTDQIEARYIFTTAFINRFMKIAEKFNYKLHAIFINNNVYILIDTGRGFQLKQKNWFEIPFFKSCSDAQNYQDFLNDFSRLLGIVETLKLNQNIGL